MDREYIISNIISELMDSVEHRNYLLPKEIKFLSENLYSVAHCLSIGRRHASSADYQLAQHKTTEQDLLVDDLTLRKLSLPEGSIDEGDRIALEMDFFHYLRKVMNVLYYETNGDYPPEFIADLSDEFVERWLVESSQWNAIETSLLVDIAMRPDICNLDTKAATDLMYTKNISAERLVKTVNGAYLELAAREILYKEPEQRRYPIILLNTVERLFGNYK